MEASFDEQVHEAIVSCIGEAALKVLVQGRELTADTVADAIIALAGDEPDIGRDFALLLLKR